MLFQWNTVLQVILNVNVSSFGNGPLDILRKFIVQFIVIEIFLKVYNNKKFLSNF